MKQVYAHFDRRSQLVASCGLEVLCVPLLLLFFLRPGLQELCLCLICYVVDEDDQSRLAAPSHMLDFDGAESLPVELVKCLFFCLVYALVDHIL